MCCLHKNLSPQSSENPLEEEVEELKGQRGCITPRKGSSLSQHEQSSYELTETGAACTGPAEVQVLCAYYILASNLVFLWDS